MIDIAVHRAGAVRLDQITYTVSENDGKLSVTVERVGGSSNSFTGLTEVPASVVIGTNDFAATAGEDYTSLGSTVVTFADGEVSKTVPVAILNDSDSENTETFSISLSSPNGGLILAKTTVNLNADEETSIVVNPGSSVKKGCLQEEAQFL